MKITAIIPARMNAHRFPGKPLANILGLPMIEHVRRRVALAPLLTEVVVATCDQEIIDVVEKYGGKAIITSSSHIRCTDRIAEAAEKLDDSDIIINVQGDEPLIKPEMLNTLLPPFEDAGILCTNLMTPIVSEEEFNSRNIVKTVFDRNNNAMYMSREALPSNKLNQGHEHLHFKQLGIIAFRADFLQEFTRLPQGPLEAIESVDMLRALENGYKVRMIVSEHRMIGVDTPADLDQAIKLMEQDTLFKKYSQ